MDENRCPNERTEVREPDEAFVVPPTIEELMADESAYGMVEAACAEGCMVEPDGYCPHGKPSWLIVKGLI